MQEDFHYYATYCAAYLAGYDHEESMDICYAAQFTDLCCVTLLSKLMAPKQAATTQLQLEMMDARTDVTGLQDITRIWSSFHFPPGDLYAEKKKHTKLYMQKYRLICRPNGVLVKDTVELAKDKPLTAVGIAMHVLADTWAHSYFAGTPSLVINNTNDEFCEYLTDEEGNESERKIKFRHNPTAPDDLSQSIYTNSLYQRNEHTVMNLGHGRAGHLPDYSFIKYRYMPAWDDYRIMIKDNPSDYMHAFGQMIEAMKYLNGSIDTFELEKYDTAAIAPHKDRIEKIIRTRRLNACEDWKAFGEELSGKKIDDFDLDKYQEEYVKAEDDMKDDTYLGSFFKSAITHKGMVSDKIYKSGNMLAGFVAEK